MNRNVAARQRQPKRFIWMIIGTVVTVLGFILTVTFVGAIIGIPLIILGLILYFVRLFIKVIKVECPHCHVPNKIEKQVQYFNCQQCNHTVRNDNGTWVSA